MGIVYLIAVRYDAQHLASSGGYFNHCVALLLSLLLFIALLRLRLLALTAARAPKEGCLGLSGTTVHGRNKIDTLH
jgi:hypothetical protein